jgi:hypothetical protein
VWCCEKVDTSGSGWIKPQLRENRLHPTLEVDRVLLSRVAKLCIFSRPRRCCLLYRCFCPSCFRQSHNFCTLFVQLSLLSDDNDINIDTTIGGSMKRRNEEAIGGDRWRKTESWIQELVITRNRVYRVTQSGHVGGQFHFPQTGA